jgi:hypothetical protein
MADYYNFQQLAQMLGISEATIVDLQKKGLLQFTVKNGRSFLSSQQTYLLRVALRRARKDKIELVEALSKVEERWLAQSAALKH